jgi:type III restriction enzyme
VPSNAEPCAYLLEPHLVMGNRAAFLIKDSADLPIGPIPYSINNVEHQYYPDFLVRIDDGHGIEDPLNLILEVTGERKKEKEAKTATARTLWVPAVNNHRGFGRWAFLEITDPYDDEVELIRSVTNQDTL